MAENTHTKNNYTVNQETPSDSIIIKEGAVDASRWKTFHSELLGFSAKYPEHIYSVETSYAPVITFRALNEDLRNKYGDIQVYATSLQRALEQNGKNREGSWKDVFNENLDLDKKTISFSKDTCHKNDPLCAIPGKMTLITSDSFYSIRRIIPEGSHFPSPMEENFMQFILSTGQNLQGPGELDELFGEIQDDVAKEVESVPEEGLKWTLERFFWRMGVGPSWSSSPVR